MAEAFALTLISSKSSSRAHILLLALSSFTSPFSLLLVACSFIFSFFCPPSTQPLFPHHFEFLLVAELMLLALRDSVDSFAFSACFLLAGEKRTFSSSSSSFCALIPCHNTRAELSWRFSDSPPWRKERDKLLLEALHEAVPTSIIDEIQADESRSFVVSFAAELCNYFFLLSFCAAHSCPLVRQFNASEIVQQEKSVQQQCWAVRCDIHNDGREAATISDAKNGELNGMLLEFLMFSLLLQGLDSTPCCCSRSVEFFLHKSRSVLSADSDGELLLPPVCHHPSKHVFFSPHRAIVQVEEREKEKRRGEAKK